MKALCPLLDLLFPHSCVGCGRMETLLCSACLARLPASDLACPVCSARSQTARPCRTCKRSLPFVDRAVWGTRYDDALVRTIITQYKYAPVRDFAYPLGILIVPPLKKLLQTISFPQHPLTLLPVPLHPRKQRERGFNQSELIAEVLQGALALPLLGPKVLARIRYTTPQAQTASREERIRNMHGAFSVCDKNAVAGKTIILVDDVLTTGSTVNEAARVLKEVGAESVWAAVAARG